MRKISLYLILLITALGAGIFISFIALRSINRPAIRPSSLPGFESDPNVPTSSPSEQRSRGSSISQPRQGGGEIGTTQTPTKTPGPNTIIYDVPFTPQAPFSEWSNPKLSNGCEEASALMAMSWVRGTTFTQEEARREIIAVSDYELANHGVYLDTSSQDTFDWIFKEYYGYNKVELFYDISVEDIKKELRGGNLVIVPVNGQELHNPYYTQPGPLRHKVVIIGYDPDNKEFITNDPGTRLGKQYRYPEQVLFNAIHDYLTGNDLPLPPKRTAMIVVKK
ncbi:MAG: C39 family peptidase [Candidatus Yanofskybacteria bacterium]|nr:C39 family peptidase [Candidatus Yanofskybacteria bacterium]